MSVVIHDRYDTEAFRGAITMHPRLPQAMKQMPPLSEELAEDLFYSFYQSFPKLAAEEYLSLSDQVYHKLLAEIMHTVEWKSVRSSGSIGDQLYSAMTASSVTKSMLEKLEKAILQKIEQLRGTEEEMKRLFGEAETYQYLANESSDEEKTQRYQGQADHNKQEAEQLQEQVEDLAQCLGAQSEQIEDAARQIARGSLKGAESEIESMQAAVSAFMGGSSKGDMGSALSVKEKIALATKVGKSDKLKRIAELTGRMERIALRVQKSKVQHPPDEIIGVTIGRDVSKLVPSETALLFEPDLEDLFYKKYIEGQLLQFDMQGSEKQGRGPLIIARDSSGSMEYSLGNTTTTKEVWAKAVTLALLAIARKEKRDFAIIDFAHGKQVKIFNFTKGEATPKQLIEAAEFFFCGGTQYEEWMKQSLELVESSAFDRADVICVSDGEVYIPKELEEDWNRRRKARGMRCYSILLGDEQGGHELSRISDAIANIDDLKEDNAALDLMFSV